jgi:hypothetical protein
VMLALMVTASPASAEGHLCRWWTPDYEYGGYWLYLDCPQEAGDGRWVGWYPEIPWFDWEHYGVQWL